MKLGSLINGKNFCLIPTIRHRSNRRQSLRQVENYFGERQVFFDIDSIPLGVDFRPYIAQVVDEIDVMIVLVGPGWAGDLKQKLWEKLTNNQGGELMIQMTWLGLK